ncbi:pitrilysin family protein [Kitasatospora sp. NPDC048540]|uniref:M16 family metallopeptidase n=1 Tax=Kitasatospora sp. NPDC048540 TaxID=3155634 RepID=UPI0033F955AD
MSSVEQLTLANGVRILTRTDHRYATAAVCVAIGAGSRHDPAGHGGSLHLLEHLLMNSRVPQPGDAEPRSLAEHIELLGGRGNAVTGLELMLLHAQVLPDLAAPTMAALASAAVHPDVTDHHFATERQAVLQELAAAAADPYDVVQDAYIRALFAGHPLGRPVGGTAEDVHAARLDRLLDIHRQLLSSAPIALIAVGPNTAEEIREAVRTTGIEDLPARDATAPTIPLAALAARSGHPAVPDEFCWLSVGGRSPHADDPARHAYTVLGHLLGNSPASLLYLRLRLEQGLGYNFQSWNRAYQDGGSWRALIGAEPENAELVIETVRSCLAEVAAHPDPAMLEAARRQAAFELFEEADSPLGQVIQLARGTYAGARPWSAADDAAALRAVTAADVQAAAATLLRDLVVVVRPEPAPAGGAR